MKCLLAMLALTMVLAGCGLGAGHGGSNINLTVTRAFGSNRVASVTQAPVRGSQTVMRMLQRSFRVQTRGGGSIESINGVSGASARDDWFYYVNGVEGAQGAASTAVHKGDRIWWDLHEWSVTHRVPAVVGSFPEPFLHGIAGRRLPTAVECAADMTKPCSRVSAALHAAGVPVASQLLGTGSGTDSLGILVGTWSEVQPVIAAALIERGPQRSGVYARFSPSGQLQLLDPRGQVARTLSAGAGLVAATRDSVSAPVWLITGTDRAGVAAAAAALTVSRLRDHFALAVGSGGADIPLPVESTR